MIGYYSQQACGPIKFEGLYLANQGELGGAKESGFEEGL
jgi:hypothetical protein